jgi:hypothetical protein
MMLVIAGPILVACFIARLYGANRARRRYEKKEIEWKKYEHFQKHNKLYIGIGAILFLIGCYGLQTEPHFIIREDILEVVEVNPLLVFFLFVFSFIIGGVYLASGLAQFVHSMKKPLTNVQE